MNLRHIDPRSTDWKDAMEEGEMQGETGKTRKREREPHEVGTEATLSAAGKHSKAEQIGPPPHPRR